MLAGTRRPNWLTFDCYGTLIQWDEGVLAAVRKMLERSNGEIDPARLIGAYDRHEHALEQAEPYRPFREVAGTALALAMQELGLTPDPDAAATLTASISAMPPFPEVMATLALLKRASFRLCIISNTDDAIIAGNVRQLGSHIDQVVTAEQARAYKPSARIFEHAFRTIGTTRDEVVHICASPHLDLTAAKELGLRAVWIDRGTGRRPPADYTPDAVLPALDGVPGLFSALGWL